MPNSPCRKCGNPTGGRKKNTLCIDCYNKERPRGEKHPRWKAAGICPECGGKKTADNSHAKRCRDCWKKNPPKGKEHPNYGRKLSDETKMKISLGNTGKRMGAENHRFNPNKKTRRTYRFPYRLWRKKVLELDGFKCVCCGGDSNIVHHINPYKDNPDNLDVNNGVALCDTCHQKTFGKEYQFIEIFEGYVKKRMNSGEAQNG